MTNLLSQSKSIAQDARNTIMGLKKERDDLIDRKTHLLKERDELFLQPLAKEDVKGIIFGYIDHQAEKFLDEGSLSGLINYVAFPKRDPHGSAQYKSPAINLYDFDNGYSKEQCFNSTIFGGGRLPLINGYDFSHGGMHGFCFYFGGILKQKIEQHFDSLFPSDWDDKKINPGLPLVERRKKIAEIDAEINEINISIKEYDNHLRSLSSSAKV